MEIVCVAIIEHSGMYLVSRRIPDGHWQFPGGKMGELETPMEAVVREVREEVGILVYPDDDISFIYTGHEPEYITFFYRCGCTTLSLPPNPEPTKNEGAIWMSPDDIVCLSPRMVIMAPALQSVMYPGSRRWERQRKERD